MGNFYIIGVDSSSATESAFSTTTQISSASIPIRIALILVIIACTPTGEPARTDSTIPAPGVPPSISVTSSCDDALIHDDRIGAVRIGASVASIKEKCQVLRDTTVTDSEGMPARRLSVEVAGETVEAEIVDDKVWRVSVKSPRYRTADALGVGTPLTRLVEMKNPRGMMGEGALYFASSEHCGLSFRLSENRPLDPSGDWNAPALRRLPTSTKVTEVLIVRGNCVKPF